uniref:Uncharacterized protein n=1 Tax=Globodera rostochiensis TaxID=31243 RepID=A0A914HG68_GLORO
MFLFYFRFLIFCASTAFELANAANDQRKSENTDPIKDDLEQCHMILSGILSAARSYHEERGRTNWQITEEIRRIGPQLAQKQRTKSKRKRTIAKMAQIFCIKKSSMPKDDNDESGTDALRIHYGSRFQHDDGNQ